MRDFRQEVVARGIQENDRAKAALLSEKAREATRYILARPLNYAICHLSYLPRALGNPSLSITKGRVPERPEGLSALGLLNVLARATCFLLAILGIPF